MGIDRIRIAIYMYAQKSLLFSDEQQQKKRHPVDKREKVILDRNRESTSISHILGV